MPNSKDQGMVYAVNDISFHPVHGTFSTCGEFSAAIHDLISHVVVKAPMAPSTSGIKMLALVSNVILVALLDNISC